MHTQAVQARQKTKIMKEVEYITDLDLYLIKDGISDTYLRENYGLKLKHFGKSEIFVFQEEC